MRGKRWWGGGVVRRFLYKGNCYSTRYCATLLRIRTMSFGTVELKQEKRTPAQNTMTSPGISLFGVKCWAKIALRRHFFTLTDVKASSLTDRLADLQLFFYRHRYTVLRQICQEDGRTDGRTGRPTDRHTLSENYAPRIPKHAERKNAVTLARKIGDAPT